MAIGRANGIVETSVTTGTGTLTLDGVQLAGHNIVPSALDGYTIYYKVEQVSTALGAPTGSFEYRKGVFTLSGRTLTRGTLYASSTGSPISFTGTLRIIMLDPVEVLAFLDVTNTFLAQQNVTPGSTEDGLVVTMAGNSGEHKAISCNNRFTVSDDGTVRTIDSAGYRTANDQAYLTGVGVWLGTSAYVGFAQSGVAYDTKDVSIYRLAAGVLTIGTGGVTGAAWLQNSVGHVRLTAPVTNVTTSLANLTGLTILVKAGRKYTGFIRLPINNALAADGFKFDLNGGDATMTSIHFGFSEALGATVGTRTSTALATAITLTVLPDTNDLWVTVPVTLVVDQAGTIIPRQAKNADAAGATLTMRTGGYFWLEDMPG